VNEQGFAPSPEDDVGLAGQFGRVKAVSIAHSMQEPTDRHLRLRILLPHGPHDPAALLGREYVHGR
jgi:hypothetical protein